jgi:hypothetical protein
MLKWIGVKNVFIQMKIEEKTGIPESRPAVLQMRNSRQRQRFINKYS